MENKYNDLILSLIKEHPKYPGYEAILEDLFDDVYSRSKVVLGTVSNEEVIVSYLKKVIASSIVTVPKKLNFNVRTRHRIISTLPETVFNKPEPKVEVVKEQPVEETSVITEVAQPIVEEKLELVEPKQEEVENVTSLIEEELVEELIITDDEEDNSVVEEDVFEDESEDSDLLEPTSDLVSENTEEPIISVDKNLVDKMINGIGNSAEIEVNEVMQKEETFELETDELIEEPVAEELDLVSVEETFELETDELSEEPVAEELELSAEEETFELETDELVEEPVAEELELSAEEETFELETDELVEEPVAEELELSAEEETFELETDELVEEPVAEELELSAEEETFELETDELVEEPVTEELELSAEEETFELETDELVEEPVVETSKVVNSVISYDCFSFNPENESTDAELILDELRIIANKHPQKKIFEVCDLKYKKGLSVKEIAEKLGFTQDNVVDILNDIIEVVKD